LKRRILKPITHYGRGGKVYHNVFLSYGVNRLVHRLVCEAFHGHAPSVVHEVAHLNDRGEDNRAENLRWATHQENCQMKSWRENAEKLPAEPPF
jgi:hypothetical protein